MVENLQLKEGEYLKRAALLLFHPAPENFITGSYIKIGYFQSDDDLKFQDEIHGNLFEQIEKSIDLLFSRYIKAEISYEGITRLEKFEYPKEAIREALLNACNKRQVKAVLHVKEKGKITNREYQSLFNVSKATATRDLSELENKQLLMNKGTKGSSSVYILFRAIYGSAIGGDFI